MSFFEKLHMIVRCWRYRFKSEVPSIRFVRNLDLGGTTMIDIGANKGIYSIYLSHAAGPAGRVVAFEAQPELESHLQAVKKSFRLDNLEIVNIGLSSKPGVLTMRREEAGSGRASVGFYDDAAEGVEELQIPVTTLDEFFADRDPGRVSFIKCDVEGHEAEVFRGGRELLKKHMPILLFECHHSEIEDGELFSFLAGLGYTGYFFHVAPKDHASLLHRGRGHYVHYSEFADHEYCRPTVKHRNYVFLRAGETPD